MPLRALKAKVSQGDRCLLFYWLYLRKPEPYQAETTIKYVTVITIKSWFSQLPMVTDPNWKSMAFVTELLLALGLVTSMVHSSTLAATTANSPTQCLYDVCKLLGDDQRTCDLVISTNETDSTNCMGLPGKADWTNSNISKRGNFRKSLTFQVLLTYKKWHEPFLQALLLKKAIWWRPGPNGAAITTSSLTWRS